VLFLLFAFDTVQNWGEEKENDGKIGEKERERRNRGQGVGDRRERVGNMGGRESRKYGS
jgi:hypothetical protein